MKFSTFACYKVLESSLVVWYFFVQMKFLENVEVKTSNFKSQRRIYTNHSLLCKTKQKMWMLLTGVYLTVFVEEGHNG